MKPDMKLGPVTWQEKQYTVKKNDDDVMSTNCDVTVIFRFMTSLEQSENRISDAVRKTYIINDSNLLSSKNWKQN